MRWSCCTISTVLWPIATRCIYWIKDRLSPLARPMTCWFQRSSNPSTGCVFSAPSTIFTSKGLIHEKFLIALALLGSLAVAGCTAQQQSSSEATGDHYTVENCGNTWGFDTVPQRVVVQDVSAVQTLAELGVLDSVVAKAGYFPDTYFDDETFQQVD